MTEKMAVNNKDLPRAIAPLDGAVQQIKQETKAEDQISVKSETPARIEDIFDWIDGLPLSKTTKNLARDFSDAVLMSEILKFYYPHLVNTHHYIPVNGVQAKKDNWRMLNKKVLSKIDLRLSVETIDQLAHSQVGVIEKVLGDFREKQMALKENFDPLLKQEFNLSGEPSLTSVHNRVVSQPERESSDYFQAVSRSFYALLGLVMRIVCFWRWFKRSASTVEAKPNNESSNTQISDETGPTTEAQLRESYAQVVQELQTKIDVVKTLCHKVAFLEGTMKLKDMKIASLMTQLEQAQAAAQSRDNQAHQPAAAAPETPYPRPPNTATISSSLKMRPKRPRPQAQV